MAKMFIFFAVAICLALVHTSRETINSRIIGGWYPNSNQFPYQVSLRISNKHFCGGALLNNRWILTAAHCVDGKLPTDIGVVVGANALQSGGISYGINKTIIHPEWNFNTLIGDIALVGTVLDIDLKDGVDTIPLSTENIGAGENVVFSGWGFTSYPGSTSNILNFIFLKTISNIECKTKLSSVAIDDSHLCTFTRKGEGVCHGDSGGPLVSTSNDELVGIASWGRITCGDGYPDLFTRILSYNNWILSQIQ